MTNVQAMEKIVTESRQLALAHIRANKPAANAVAAVLYALWDVVKSNDSNVQDARRATVRRTVMTVLHEKGLVQFAA